MKEGPSETMFDHLKKQKKLLLLSFIGKGRVHPVDSKPVQFKPTEYKPIDPKPIDSKPIDPKSVESVPIPKPQEKKPSKSFLQMISSNVLKGAVSKYTDEDKENYPFRKFQHKTADLKSAIEGISAQGQGLKDQWKFINMEINFFLKCLSESPDDQIKGRAKDFKEKIKQFEAYMSKLRVELPQMEDFFQGFPERLIEVESKAKQRAENNHSRAIRSSEEKASLEMEQVKSELKKTQRQLQVMSRRHEKTLADLERKENDDHLVNRVSHFQKVNKDLQEIVSSKEAQLANAQQDKAGLQQSLYTLKSQLNRLKRQIDEGEAEFTNRCLAIRSERELQYTEQINSLKAQSSRDIVDLINIYKNKEIEAAEKRAQIESKLEWQRSTIEVQAAQLLKLEETSMSWKASATKLRRQSECLAGDMRRLSEEVRQQWGALKDVKLLSTRMGNFDRFERIYEEIGFNDIQFS